MVIRHYNSSGMTDMSLCPQDRNTSLSKLPIGERGNGGPSIISETPYVASTVEPLNTFIHPFDKRSMPLLRVIGGKHPNSGLSILFSISSLVPQS